MTLIDIGNSIIMYYSHETKVVSINFLYAVIV
jgi:hypothetical protein